MSKRLTYKYISMPCILLAAVVMASCSQDDDSVAPRQQEITFATPVISSMTRAKNGEITGITYPTDKTFIVTARRYQGEFQGWMLNTETEIPFEEMSAANPQDVISYNAMHNIWHPKEAHYYKYGYNYVFAAVSPSEIRTSGQIQNIAYRSDKGMQITDFKPSTDLTKHMDIMYTGRVYDRSLKNITKTGVDLNFKHALSSIHFRVCVSPDFVREMAADGNASNDINNGDYRIRSIKIEGFNNCGEFTENVDDVKRTVSPKWKLSADNTENGLTTQYEFVKKELSIPADGDKTGIDDAAIDITDATYDGYSAMFIPQQLTTTAKVTIEYTKNGNAGGTGPKWETKVLFLNDGIKPYTVEWKMGFRYTYTIAFTSDVIYFSPNVTDMQNNDITIL